MNDTEKYTSMLNKARSFMKRWDGVDTIDSKLAMSELKEIFTELNESEDEKIKNAILKGLIDCRDAPDLGWSDFGGIPIDDCIAWLEKQGGQKTADRIEGVKEEYIFQCRGREYVTNSKRLYDRAMSYKDDEESFPNNRFRFIANIPQFFKLKEIWQRKI